MDEYTNAYYEMFFEENNIENIYTEKILTFGNKTYPKYGNVVILAGGSGSGKSFQLEHMLGITGKQLDVDSLKTFVLNSKFFQKEILKQYNIDITTMSLDNPEDTNVIHKIIKDMQLVKKYNDNIFKSLKESVEKANLIFDKTCSSLKDITTVSYQVQEAGYKKENIHLVWILTKYETALIQNQQRERHTPNDIILATHIGTASVFNAILTNPELLLNYLDGDIYISFNQAGVDTHAVHTNANKLFVTDFEYIKIKEQGKPIIPINEIKQEILDKISDYVPTTQLKYNWKHLKEF